VNSKVLSFSSLSTAELVIDTVYVAIFTEIAVDVFISKVSRASTSQGESALFIKSSVDR
jgi:hypothetical protein